MHYVVTNSLLQSTLLLITIAIQKDVIALTFLASDNSR